MILVIIMMNTLAEKILSLNCPSHLRDRDTGLIKKTLLAHLIAQNSRTCKIVSSPHGHCRNQSCSLQRTKPDLTNKRSAV